MPGAENAYCFPAATAPPAYAGPPQPPTYPNYQTQPPAVPIAGGNGLEFIMFFVMCAKLQKDSKYFVVAHSIPQASKVET